MNTKWTTLRFTCICMFDNEIDKGRSKVAYSFELRALTTWPDGYMWVTTDQWGFAVITMFGKSTWLTCHMGPFLRHIASTVLPHTFLTVRSLPIRILSIAAAWFSMYLDTIKQFYLDDHRFFMEVEMHRSLRQQVPTIVCFPFLGLFY